MEKKEISLYKKHPEEMLRKLRDGEQKAQFLLYKQHNEDLYRKSLKINPDKQVARDLVNQAFLCAIDRIHTYNERDPFSAWLEGILVKKSRENELQQKTLQRLQSSRKATQSRKIFARSRLKKSFKDLWPGQLIL